MAVTFLFGTGNETSVAPPTHAAGDWLYLLVECSSGTVTTPAGWSIAPGFPVTHNGGATVLSVFRRLAVDGATPNAALAGGTNHMWGVIVRVRGAHQTEPQDTEASSPGTGASVNGYAPGIVTKSATTKVLAMIAWSLDSAGPISSAEANASLSSVVEEYDAGTLTNDGGGLSCISGDKATAGAVVPTTCTLTSTSFCSGTIAFKVADPPSIYTAAGVARINGATAPDGAIVEIWDVIQGIRVGSITLASGNGSYALSVPYNDANRYRAVFDNGTNFGASPKAAAV